MTWQGFEPCEYSQAVLWQLNDGVAPWLWCSPDKIMTQYWRCRGFVGRLNRKYQRHGLPWRISMEQIKNCLRGP